ncbi:MAG: hypothetical protein JSW05_07180 [Candidatus Thorarchaeota archaeon]|nr:MAG: hypothetical protein JSW05_07180 [Candidatus Thorarchaeota archaeon]
MEYIMFWEYDSADHNTVMDKLKQYRDKVKKNPEKHAKFTSKNYSMVDGPEGFQLVETDDPEHLVDIVRHYMPEVRFRFAPIVELRKVDQKA